MVSLVPLFLIPVLLGAVIYGVVLIVSNAKVPLPTSHGRGADVMNPYPDIITLASDASIALETLSATLTTAVPTTIPNTKKSEAPKVEVPEVEDSKVEDPEIEIPNNDIPVDRPLATKEHPKFTLTSTEIKPTATPTKAPLLPGILPIDPLHPNLKGEKEDQPDQKDNNDDENDQVEDDGDDKDDDEYDDEYEYDDDKVDTRETKDKGNEKIRILKKRSHHRSKSSNHRHKRFARRQDLSFHDVISVSRSVSMAEPVKTMHIVTEHEGQATPSPLPTANAGNDTQGQDQPHVDAHPEDVSNDPAFQAFELFVDQIIKEQTAIIEQALIEIVEKMAQGDEIEQFQDVLERIAVESKLDTSLQLLRQSNAGVNHDGPNAMSRMSVLTTVLHTILPPFITQLRSDLRKVLLRLCNYTPSFKIDNVNVHFSAGENAVGKVSNTLNEDDTLTQKLAEGDAMHVFNPTDGSVDPMTAWDPRIGESGLACLETHWQVFSKDIMDLFWRRVGEGKEFLIQQLRSLMGLTNLRPLEMIPSPSGHESHEQYQRFEAQSIEDSFFRWFVDNILKELRQHLGSGDDVVFDRLLNDISKFTGADGGVGVTGDTAGAIEKGNPGGVSKYENPLP